VQSGGAPAQGRAAVFFCGVSPDGVRVAFQLDRFEQTGDDRLEVAGRWYGVRGLRFVRPALTVQTKEGERNLLALLEHKPWAAEEGESWVAAFPWKGESPDPGNAELAVAPSVVVTLTEDAQAGGAKRGVGGRRSSSERLAEVEQRARRMESEVAWLREEREALLADKQRAADLAGELGEARSAADALKHERDTAVRERDRAREEQQAAAQAAEAAQRSREEAESERDQALAARDSALAEFEQSVRDCTEAVRERDRALAEREQLAAERDDAIEARRRALAERDAALGRGAGFPAVSAADLERQPHAPAAGRPAPGTPLARAIAVAALVVLVLVVILLLKLA
jgi:hypothetical protein